MLAQIYYPPALDLLPISWDHQYKTLMIEFFDPINWLMSQIEDVLSFSLFSPRHAFSIQGEKIFKPFVLHVIAFFNLLSHIWAWCYAFIAHKLFSQKVSIFSTQTLVKFDVQMAPLVIHSNPKPKFLTVV